MYGCFQRLLLGSFHVRPRRFGELIGRLRTVTAPGDDVFSKPADGVAANLRGGPRVIPSNPLPGKDAAMLRATLAIVVGLLITAAPASAGTAVGNPGDRETRVTCAFPDVCKVLGV